MKPRYKAVSIPLELARKIDKLVGKRKRAAFMRETVEQYPADPELVAMLKLKLQDHNS